MLQDIASNNPRLCLLCPELNEKDLFPSHSLKSFYFSYFPLGFSFFCQLGSDDVLCKPIWGKQIAIEICGTLCLVGRRVFMPQREAVKVIKEQGSQYSLTPSANTSRNEPQLLTLLIDPTHSVLINIHPIIEKAMFVSGSLSTHPGVSPLDPAAGVRNLEIHPEAEKLMQMGPNIIQFHEINDIDKTLLDSTIQNSSATVGTLPNNAVGNFRHTLKNK